MTAVNNMKVNIIYGEDGFWLGKKNEDGVVEVAIFIRRDTDSTNAVLEALNTLGIDVEICDDGS